MLSAATLLDFERAHPGHRPSKQAAIESELGVSVARYYQLLHRAASTPHGEQHDPITAHRVLRLIGEPARHRAS